MSFTLWSKTFVDNLTVVPGAFLNKMRLELARAIDGGQGGLSTPTARVDIKGAGGQFDPWFGGSLQGEVALGTNGIIRVKYAPVDTTDANLVVNAAEYDHYELNKTVTATRDIQLPTVAGGAKAGMVKTFANAGGTGVQQVDVRDQEGGGTVILSFTNTVKVTFAVIHDGTNWRPQAFSDRADFSVITYI